MDTTVRNLDEDAYRRAKARAALEGKNIGEVISDALNAYTRSGAPGAPAEATSPAKEPRRPDARKSTAPARFERPFPKRGAFVENPLVIVEVSD